MPVLRLGRRMVLTDRGAPGGGVSGWGLPRYAAMAPLRGVARPMPVGARYYCGDGYDHAHETPCAMGNNYDSTRQQYQQAIIDHYTAEHPDLHYPADQAYEDFVAIMAKAAENRKAMSKGEKLHHEVAVRRRTGYFGDFPIKGGLDVGSKFLPVSRPRELPDLTEFDFPDANVADAGTEEIELDQLISIAARQGRRFLGVALQNITTEMDTEFLTVNSADHAMEIGLQLNTRTGAHNLDDAEQIWRKDWAVVSTDAEPASAMMTLELEEGLDVVPGGKVYVAPRLFWRFANNLDRQVDTGDLFVRIATIAQPLTTFLLFELLEEFSGLFGLT